MTYRWEIRAAFVVAGQHVCNVQALVRFGSSSAFKFRIMELCSERPISYRQLAASTRVQHTLANVSAAF